ncbi:MAG: fatty acid desaturase [Gemmatimonadaceae bacterium]
MALSRSDVPRELLTRATIRGLVRMTIEEWGMIVVLLALVAVCPWWTYPVLLVPLAGRFHALGVILHDLTHMPLRSKSLGARFVEVLCGYPIASTLNAMRYHHLRHHRDSGMETDPYYKDGRHNALWWTLNVARGLGLIPFWTVRAVVGACAYQVRGLRNAYARIFLQDRSGADPRDSREVIDCARAEFGQVAFQAVVVAAIVAWPAAMVWGYVVPVSVTGLLSAWRVLIEHNYERVSDRRVETIIAITNDHHLNLWGALALAPRNIGYHIVHHVHPHVSLTALPMLRDWYASRHPDTYPGARAPVARRARTGRPTVPACSACSPRHQISPICMFRQAHVHGQGNLLHAAGRGRSRRTSGGVLPLQRLQPVDGT